MKKTILGVFTVILVIGIMAMTIMAIDLELNLKIRQKINEVLKPYEIITPEAKVVYLSTYSTAVDVHSEEVIQIFEQTGDAYMNVDQLSLSNATAHFDSARKVLSIVGDEHIQVDNDGNVQVNDQLITDKVHLKQIEDDVYVNLTELNRMESGARLGFFTLPPSNTSQNIVVLNKYLPYQELIVSNKTWLFDQTETAKEYIENTKSQTFYYKIKNIFSKTNISGILKKSKVYVSEVDENTIQVITEDGQMGYLIIQSQYKINIVEGQKAEQKMSHLSTYDGKIVLTWEAVYSNNPDTAQIPEMKSLNIISPTWYELSDESGNIKSKASINYVEWAKSKKYKIWALASNAFEIDRTHAFLSSSEARMKFIRSLMEEAEKYGYDGINLDFENVYLEDKELLTHFVHELANYCHIHNLVLSMDVTIMGGSDNWSKCYDHKKLGEIVDFLIIMTYDEYWASSPKSGPVASYDWMYSNMEALAQLVDTDKLIMGIPLYTRVWREYPSSEKTNTYKTKSSAIGMEAQNNLIEKYSLKPIWDETDKLYYATFFEEDAQVKIWIENADTIAAKLEIINALNLKGVAAWKRGFETPDIWPLFDKIK